ncbi:hypothetical protein NKR23_g12341 [Pleurostoma richardsiae]|uniref:Uncharacterized protein n=1 Tax=Pleurostoma richardsiae TaxID=41990 RepID=A0AA38R628_9PEZI|nr:hypothetical protein NKR23_g12341 [Pleurostoma richardsiae]
MQKAPIAEFGLPEQHSPVSTSRRKIASFPEFFSEPAAEQASPIVVEGTAGRAPGSTNFEPQWPALDFGQPYLSSLDFPLGPGMMPTGTPQTHDQNAANSQDEIRRLLVMICS